MKCSFCSETEALAVKIFFFSFIFFAPLTLVIYYLVISPLRPVTLSGGSSVAPHVTNTITSVPHPPKPSTPPSVSVTTFVFTKS